MIWYIYLIYPFYLYSTTYFNKKRPSNTSILFFFYFIYFIYYKKPFFIYGVRLTETGHSLYILVLFCWFWLLLLCSF